ncbi:Methyltransferase type 12 [Candidatus Accumulibacter aalborgensis]|uniref:Methyltransferase type 12 n=1 Tax=Candidatus Accumulibacter aalborgensis TaxID=1860102 RepID=A0A1A8XW03_9PROT|nr:class I SAM-dependent methyltransferase [Candidatus Accumulibacter aalborgensis]SBT09194.1 Methyltransferase type 12 [Candidatus Accumulibacter aalborgensis]
MTTLPSTHHFDSRATTWDADPDKHSRALAVAEGIRSQVPLSPAMHALEYGCGTGLLSFALQPDLEHISLADSSPGMLAVLNEKITANGITNMWPRQLDLVTDPLPQESYDLIYSLMTLHHVSDTSGMLKNLHALLASPGYLCVADLDAEDGSFHGPGFEGHHGFDRDALGATAESAGFQDIRFTTVFRMTKGDGPNPTVYPVFLMVARK